MPQTSDWILQLAAFCERKWLAIRDRLFFFTEERNRKRLENIALSMPIYGQIDANVKSGALPKNLADELIRDLAARTIPSLDEKARLTEGTPRTINSKSQSIALPATK